MLTKSAFIFILFIKFNHAQDLPTVSTASGKIRGHYLVSHEGQNYEAYEGIPYALPPVGDRRFEPPQPVEPWSGELVADKFKTVCLGHTRNVGSAGDYLVGTEDCLYLNVYVPTKKSNRSLPVMFWIYGGAFQYSTLAGTEQHYFMDHSVIFVSINYRLGSLGFLSTEDEVVPGNMGLKDQSLGLQWVSKNIEYFGGDAKKIMLVGLSAGGASVHYHYLSPMSKGLFHTGLSLSGTAFNSWTQARNSREKAIKLGRSLKCPTSDMRSMLDCLKKTSAQDVVKAQATFMMVEIYELTKVTHTGPAKSYKEGHVGYPFSQALEAKRFTPFGPVVEKFSSKPFIDRSPIEIIRSGDVYDVPWTTGVVSEEGLYPVGEFMTNNTVLKELDENWESIAPHLLQYNYTIPKADHAAVARKIRNHYFGSKPIGKGSTSNLIQMVSDRIFIADAEKAAREQAKANKSPVMFYYYSHRANNSLSDFMTNTEENYGVSHADDALIVIKNTLINPTKTKEDTFIFKELIKLWTTLAYDGLPHHYPQWERVDPNNEALKYLHIKGPNNFSSDVHKNLAQKKFWNTIGFGENTMNPNSI